MNEILFTKRMREKWFWYSDCCQDVSTCFRALWYAENKQIQKWRAAKPDKRHTSGFRTGNLWTVSCSKTSLFWHVAPSIGAFKTKQTHGQYSRQDFIRYFRLQANGLVHFNANRQHIYRHENWHHHRHTATRTWHTKIQQVQIDTCNHNFVRPLPYAHAKTENYIIQK